MNLKKYFSISRFFLLMKLEVFRSTKGLLMTLAILFGLLFLFPFLLTIAFDFELSVYKHGGAFAFSLLVGGFILSSMAFNDLSSTHKRFRYLTLPASTFEKFLCMWLLTSVGWIFIYTLAFIAYSSLANTLGSVLFRNIIFLPFEPLSTSTFSAIKYYFVLQGIFLAGAATFKAYVFPKTIFSVVLFALACGLIGYFIMSDMFKLDDEYFTDAKVFMTMPVYFFWKAAVWMFWWILAPLSWLISYWGIKEKEV